MLHQDIKANRETDRICIRLEKYGLKCEKDWVCLILEIEAILLNKCLTGQQTKQLDSSANKNRMPGIALSA